MYVCHLRMDSGFHVLYFMKNWDGNRLVNEAINVSIYLTSLYRNHVNSTLHTTFSKFKGIYPTRFSRTTESFSAKSLVIRE